MHTLEKWPADQQRWDDFRAFHVGIGRYGPGRHGHSGIMVLFDTGELILTKAMPDPDQRGSYSADGGELTRSDESRFWFTPDGLEFKKAWCQASGSQ